MKSLVIAVIFIFSCTVVRGQTILGNPKVAVLNATEDGKFALVLFDGKPTGMIAPGESVSEFFFAQSGSTTQVVVQVCDQVKFKPIVTLLPTWVRDKTIVGELSIEDGFLYPAIPESVLKERINQLKKRLDQKGVLGRKAMKRDLDHWFEAVRRAGLGAQVPMCDGIAQILTRSVILFGNAPTTHLSIEGYRQQGYSLFGY